ncbi:TetR family transcriptional regulator C-terminal domain-containing protein [Caulobacter henricii]|uniref:TetR family transcriptional regulator n=1 Tax=Caulobacter henricii TaxID=69395 RepID=A0A0N7JHV5_9CAUL|nr:TetR family transcriptional regulator C-terminal domain-containing protein [Caulobacter henricii]ALL14450.1 TetR family transcriptional regulator [Caulobacter henricii]
MTRAPFTRETADTRRQALVAAAETVLARDGVAGASVRAICAEAGVSPGLLRHYFDGVEALFAAAYEAVGQRIDAALEAAVAQAGPAPRARLSAFLTASFKPPVLDEQLLAAWLAFWSLVKVNAVFADIHRRTYAGYRARLEDLLAACDPSADARLAAIGLTAVVDGLWLELCLDPTVFTPAEAGAIAERLLAGYSPTPVFLD